MLFLILPPRTRLWGLAWAALFGVLTLAIWPAAVRQLDLMINFPRPLRIDYILLVWAAIPWLWAHPRWFEIGTWRAQVEEARTDVAGSVARWWGTPARLRVAWRASIEWGRHFLGLDEAGRGARREAENSD